MSEGPTLRQLRYFLQAVETGSFSAAADAEFVAQPSLSEQIRRLERILGEKLFTRTSRKLQLTDFGRQMVPLARQTVTSADDLASTARDARGLSRGEVLFGTFNSAYQYLLIPLISEFRSLHPQVRVRVVGLNSAEVADSVRTGQLEAGLVQLPVDDHQLTVGPPVLVDEVVFASADSSHTTKPVSITDLANATLILSEAHWHKEDPLRRGLAERSSAVGVTVEPEIEVEFQAAALELAAKGVGDTLASYFITRPYVAANRIFVAPLYPPYKERFAFITRAGGVLSPATRRFIAMAHRHIGQLQSQAANWDDNPE